MTRLYNPLFARAGLLSIALIGVAFGAETSVGKIGEPPPRPAFTTTIARVVDGDTLEIVRDGQRVKARLFDVDCPELNDTNGNFAKKVAEATVAGRRVWLFPSGKRATDRYGRVLVRVWTKKGWLSDVLLKVGAATRYVDPDRPTLGLAKELRPTTPTPAKTATTPSPKPPVTKTPAVTKPTEPVDDPTVYITRTGKKYHRNGCRYLRKSRIPLKLSEAKARGYTPCSVCVPPG